MKIDWTALRKKLGIEPVVRITLPEGVDGNKLLGDVFTKFWSDHKLTCPCGATCHTRDDALAAKFLETHKSHTGGKP